MREHAPKGGVSEVVDPEPVGPVWPRDRWIGPTVLNNYRICPKQVRLQHIDKVDAPWQFWPHLSKGRVAHLALKRIADALARNRQPIDSAEVARMARRHVPRQPFPSTEAHEASLRDIERWVAFGRRYLERIPDPEWLLVERNQTRRYRVFPGIDGYTLMARPDVVVQRMDEDGVPLVEIIDYKTGVIRPEPDPPVLMRFVARDLLARQFGDASTANVRFTYLWLDHADTTQIDLSVEHCNDAWPDVTGQVRALASESVWAATPSTLCHYCPYHRNICREEIPVEA